MIAMVSFFLFLLLIAIGLFVYFVEDHRSAREDSERYLAQIEKEYRKHIGKANPPSDFDFRLGGK